MVSPLVRRGAGFVAATGTPKRWWFIMMMMLGAMMVVVALLMTSNMVAMMKCYPNDVYIHEQHHGSHQAHGYGEKYHIPFGGANPNANRELHQNGVSTTSPLMNSLSMPSSFSTGTTLVANNNNDDDGLHNSTGKFVIFYNAFVNPNLVNKSLGIMKQQMLQVYNSSHWNTTVYYNILGYNLTTSTRFCPDDMDCRFHRYIPEGDEVETISDLYHYCIHHPLDSVVYLHDKGSYNYVGRNHWIRQVGTRSALSDACRYTMPALDCNVCLMKFHYLPNPHTQGNFWTAQCSYIRTLIPPMEYDARRRDMMMDLFLNQQKVLANMGCFYILLEEVMGTLKKTLKANVASNHPLYDGMYAKHLSLGRYAMESWIMSAPWSRPCHTMAGQVRSYNRHTWIPVVQKGVGPSPIHYVNETSTGWFLWYGRLYEYQTLYNNTVPPRDSWFYEKTPFAIVQDENAMNCTPMPPYKEPRRRPK